MLVGCERTEDIRTYQAPKDTAPVAPQFAASSTPGTTAAGEVPTWVLPGGWTQSPEQQGMRFATIQVAADDPQTSLTVIPLGSESGGLVANINRWEEQLGLPPSGPDELARVIRQTDLNGMTVTLVDLPGAEQRTLAAIVPRSERTWYFKLTGKAAAVEAQKRQFDEFVQSIRFQHTPPPTQQMAGSGMGVTTTRGDAQPEWAVPPGWVQEPARPMRVATFRTSPEPGAAEVIISRFGAANFGGPLDNINRWRGMVGLDPVESTDDQPVERIQVDGNDAAFFDMTGPARDGLPARRMLMIMASAGDTVWFFRMIGEAEVVENHKAGYDEFIRSVKFGS
jgi:hypothetical protein